MEFTVNGYEYSTKRLSAMDQFHVARRITPIIAAMAESRAGASDGQAVFAALAGLSDAETEWVLNKLLEGAERRNSGIWSPVRQKGATMFELDLQEMLMVCYQVFQANFGNFIGGLPSLSALAGLIKT